MEIVVRDAEQRLGLAVVLNPGKFERFAAQVHVREKAEQQCIVGERSPSRDAIVRLAGRDFEAVDSTSEESGRAWPVGVFEKITAARV